MFIEWKDLHVRIETPLALRAVGVSIRSCRSKCVCISVGAAHTILRREKDKCQMDTPSSHKKKKKKKKKKLARVRIAKQLLKQFPKYNNQSFANITTGDETWVHFYEPKRKTQNTIWATKGGKRPCTAKRTMDIKKVMYVIIFTNQGPAIQIAIPKGKSVNARLYKGNVLHKLKKYFLSRRPATGLRGVRFLHENASSQKRPGKGCRASAPSLFARFCPL